MKRIGTKETSSTAGACVVIPLTAATKPSVVARL